jgi:hypothetical protein
VVYLLTNFQISFQIQGEASPTSRRKTDFATAKMPVKVG